jgi:hypothetical protein
MRLEYMLYDLLEVNDQNKEKIHQRSCRFVKNDVIQLRHKNLAFVELIISK